MSPFDDNPHQTNSQPFQQTVNRHNCVCWAEDNPHITVEIPLQTLARVTEAVVVSSQRCNDAGGHHFEHLLSTFSPESTFKS
jgi:hypothetical protein